MPRGAMLGRCVAALLSFGLVGCSDGSGDDAASAGTGGESEPSSADGTSFSGAGGSAASSVTQLQACVAYIDSFCEVQARCGLGVSDEADRRAERSDCLVRYGTYCPDALFSAGSVRTIEDALACAAAWPTISCSAYERDASPACAVPGTRAVDEPCLFGTQCASGSCSKLGTECGVCDAVAAEGEPCGSPKCARGTYCDSNGQSTCVASPPEDDVPATQSIPGLGETCEPTIGCGGESQALCAKDPRNGDYACAPWPTLGQDCTQARACLYGDSYCNDNLLCVALPVEGAACATNFHGQRACGRDLKCDTAVTPAVCRARPGAGELCQEPCASGLTCLCDEGGCAQRHCRHLRLAGEPCADADDACLPGATRCENGVCADLGFQGLVEAKCGP